MAVDAALLDQAVRTARSAPMVRLYGWSGTVLSVGANQAVDAGLRRRCRQHGVELVRRPTGGSAVLHGCDLTYAVVAPYRGMSVLEAYWWVASGLIAGLAHLGLEAEVARHRFPSRGRALGPSSACFAEAVGADLHVAGRKICGSAQKRARKWFLQHGSIPIADQCDLTGRLLEPDRLPEYTCLEELRPGTGFEQARLGLVEGFRQAWGEPRVMTEPEAFAGWEIRGKGSGKVVLA